MRGSPVLRRTVLYYFVSWFGILSCNASFDIPRMSERPVKPMITKPGDLYVAILVHVSPYNVTTSRCGSTPVSIACDPTEMIVYATEMINRRSDILPNITLGFIAIDGCNIDIKSLEAVTYILAYDDVDCPATSEPQTTPAAPSGRNANFSSVLRHYRAIGLVMTGSSRVAVAIAPLLGIYQIPLIGMSASSDELSDKSRYQYFLRLIAADTYQALAVLSLAKYFGWTYVSVVYSEGAYGENGLNQILTHLKGAASGYGICIAVAAKISAKMYPEDFDAIADELVQNRKARVIIVYVESPFIISPLFDSLNRKIDPNPFILLSGDAIHMWEFQPIIKQKITEGAIFLEHIGEPMPDFEKFLAATTPQQSQGNPWILSLWEQRYQCSFDAPDNDTSRCAMNLSLDASVCPTIQSLDSRVYDSVAIFADAAHRVIAEDCPEEFARRSNLQKCLRGSRMLQTILSNTFNGLLGAVQFTNTGDYMENLLVKQYVTADGVRKSKIVGHWDTAKTKVKMYDSLIEWNVSYNQHSSGENTNKTPISVCSFPCEAKTYSVQQSIPCCWICASCRNNEIILPTRKGCKACPTFYWPDDQTSTACLPIDPDYLKYFDVISMCMACLAVVVGLMVLLCVAFFVVNRDNKLVKALSFQLCLIILCGKLIACISVILFLVPANSSPGVCVARKVGFHLGICLVYSPLLVKNIRIYRIFSAGKRSVKAPRFVSSEAQLLITSMFVFLQFLLVTLSEALSKSVATMDMPSPFEKYVELYCYQSTVWFLVCLFYNIAVMLLCAAIGFVTRKLPNNFNESWFILISVSTTLFSWIVFIPAYFSVSRVHLQAAILGFALVLICVVTLICQYVPVVYALLFFTRERENAVGTVGPVNIINPSSG